RYRRVRMTDMELIARIIDRRRNIERLLLLWHDQHSSFFWNLTKKSPRPPRDESIAHVVPPKFLPAVTIGSFLSPASRRQPITRDASAPYAYRHHAAALEAESSATIFRSRTMPVHSVPGSLGWAGHIRTYRIIGSYALELLPILTNRSVDVKRTGASAGRDRSRPDGT